METTLTTDENYEPLPEKKKKVVLKMTRIAQIKKNSNNMFLKPMKCQRQQHQL